MDACRLGSVAAVLAGAVDCAGSRCAPLSQLAVATRHDRRRRTSRGGCRCAGRGDELDEVAIAFNDTLARLEHAVGEMRQFSAALAHELRTPLAALRGEIETGAAPDAQADATDTGARVGAASSRRSTS